jgi:arylsulfatase A-like enzyme
MKMKVTYLTWTLLTLLALTTGCQQSRKTTPNIIFFLCDDLGWRDLECYGSTYYETPHIDELAAEGMLFTQAYAANPLCSPTRASIMTGKYPVRLGFFTPAGHLPPNPDQPWYDPQLAAHRKVIPPNTRTFLDTAEYTIAEAFRDAGYATAHMGKWHMGVEEMHFPDKQGFEVTVHGAPDPGPRSYFAPYNFPKGNFPEGPEGEYIADRLTIEALKFIEDNQDRPFLLHLWHYNVHGPWGYKEELAEPFHGKKDPQGLQDNPVMGSMIRSLDISLGRVVAKLKELGIYENTIIVFFSDNGGNVHSLITEKNLLCTNNAPLRYGKAFLHEGGIRVPMIVSWPGVVKPGTRSSDLVSSVDFYPTMMEMAGIKETSQDELDGISLVPLLKKGSAGENRAIFNAAPAGFFFEFPPAACVHRGKWKLIKWYETNHQCPDEYELFDLEQDIGESTNVASLHPDLVKELAAEIDKVIEHTGAKMPIPNPAYDPAAGPLYGWHPGAKTDLEKGEDCLVAKALYKSPDLRTYDLPAYDNTLTVEITMKAEDPGRGRVGWGMKTWWSRDMDQEPVWFEVKDSDTWQTCRAEIPANETLTRLDLSPLQGAKQVQIRSVILKGLDGSVLKEYDFTKEEE